MSVSTERPGPYEVLGRERKVRIMTDYMIEKLIALFDKSPELWAEAAKDVGVNTPSETSRGLIKEILRGRK